MSNNISDEQREALARKAADITEEISRALGAFDPDDTTPEPINPSLPVLDESALDSFHLDGDRS